MLRCKRTVSRCAKKHVLWLSVLVLTFLTWNNKKNNERKTKTRHWRKPCPSFCCVTIIRRRSCTTTIGASCRKELQRSFASQFYKSACKFVGHRITLVFGQAEKRVVKHNMFVIVCSFLQPVSYEATPFPVRLSASSRYLHETTLKEEI